MYADPPMSFAQDQRLSAEHMGSSTLTTIEYLPDFLGAAQEKSLVEELTSRKAGWKQVSGRRVQVYGGTVLEKSGALLSQPLPRWLQTVVDAAAERCDFGGLPPNHVLVNAYEPGEGILPHEDGPIYYPCACIVSLQAPGELTFDRKLESGGTERAASAILLPCSLICFAGEAYSTCLHSITAAHACTVAPDCLNAGQLGLGIGTTIQRTGTRISLTIRRVLKVRKGLVQL